MISLEQQIQEYEKSVAECEITLNGETNQMVYDLVYAYGYTLKEIKTLIFLLGEKEFGDTNIDTLNVMLWDIFGSSPF